jgi:hypothetical protein
MKQAIRIDQRSLDAAVTKLTLPAPNGTRWNVRRKMEVVTAVLAGVLSLDQACARYALSIEEFLDWRRLAVCEAGASAKSRRTSVRVDDSQAHHGANA